ncbi:gamma-glutamyl-gamma-aminobutyrate hydrolase family protein [Clostridium sediminicola]|uniref:gamma-glutamyl-gamma-aminobutyrate hydrolase family protein n=1 Tax=Clostridium sediminicola TaxID=3114879 RepID=UPI0031F1D7DB
MKKPVIGITTYYIYDYVNATHRHIGAMGQDIMMAPADYYNAVHKAGGVPMPIMSIDDDEYIDSIVEKMDKFIFSGGGDVDPLYYNESVMYRCGNINDMRDKFEMKLLKKVIEAKKPILGICRGFQLINIFLGGTLYQDLKTQYNSNLNHSVNNVEKYKKVHKNIFQKDSILEKLFKTEEILTNSKHHQAIKTLAKGLKIESKSEDNIIEGFSSEELNLLAVQWHPEMMFETHEEQLELFKWLIEA